MTACGETERAIEITKVNPFEDITKRTFLPFYEEILSSFTEASFMDCIQMDFEYIKEEARNFYYTPYVIAERITYEIFSRSKKQIYTTFTKNRYTEEFISECCERESYNNCHARRNKRIWAARTTNLRLLGERLYETQSSIS